MRKPLCTRVFSSMQKPSSRVGCASAVAAIALGAPIAAAMSATTRVRRTGVVVAGIVRLNGVPSVAGSHTVLSADAGWQQLPIPEVDRRSTGWGWVLVGVVVGWGGCVVGLRFATAGFRRPVARVLCCAGGVRVGAPPGPPKPPIPRKPKGFWGGLVFGFRLGPAVSRQLGYPKTEPRRKPLGLAGYGVFWRRGFRGGGKSCVRVGELLEGGEVARGLRSRVRVGELHDGLGSCSRAVEVAWGWRVSAEREK